MKSKLCACALGACLIVVVLAALTPSASGAGCGQSTGPDVVVGGCAVDGDTPSYNYNAVSNYNTAVINSVTYDTLSMGTTSCNWGNQPLKWYSTDNEHPAVSQNFYRLKNVNGARRFEQLAQAWTKHGFCALRETLCCTTCQAQCSSPCSTTTCLGVGCSDPYTSGRNGSQTSNRAPKYQVNATTGVNQSYQSTSSGVTPKYRLHINVADLEVSNGTGDVNTTRYFGECMYVQYEDANFGNKNNNASYRAIKVTNPGGADGWHFDAAFASSNTTQTTKPGIQAWADTDTTATIPGVITRVVLTNVTTPEDNAFTGLVIIGAQATNLNNGFWHYEYAVNNMNSDRSISSFSIPVPVGANITNVGFRDVDYWDGDGVSATGVGGTNYDGTDWPWTISGGSITWACAHTYAQHQGANAIRWGTMYNFRFDCDQGPLMAGNDVQLTNATMSQFKPNGVQVTGATIVPTACVGPVVNPIHNESATCGVSFTSQNPSLSSGTGPITWSLGAGSPAGMTINSSTGAVTWPVPLTSGSPYSITINATNNCGSGGQTLNLTVNPNPPTVNPMSNAFATCGLAYISPTPTTSGGSAPLAWTLDTGPAGMTINGNGSVSWPSPVATGSPFTVTIHADSANGCGSSSQVSWSIGVVIGDFTNDGLVTEADIPAFADNLLQDSPVCAGDINNDGLVDGNDIAAFDAALGL